MKLHKEIAEELIWTKEIDGIEVVEKEEGENRRWSRTNRIVISKDGKFYAFHWEEGLTEYQETDMIGDANTVVDDHIELVEVKPVEKTVVTYELCS